MREVKFSLLAVFALFAILAAACDGSTPGVATAAPSSTTAAPPSPTDSARPPTATPVAIDPDLPTGFPLDLDSPTDLVTGPLGSRVIETGAGPTVREAAALQATDDATRANASGWNCRVHVEYEGSAAVDWYVPTGTPVYATTDGDAVLIVNTLANAFDFYGVDREPYIGDPDRSRAPLNPFPGPGGGMGVYVAVIGDAFRTDYGHLAIASTLDAVPESAFAAPYSRAFDYASAFATPQPSTFGVQVAQWSVRKGDLIGYTGDAGYSEAPHLHYVITERASGRRLCPTEESGFDGGGWLTR